MRRSLPDADSSSACLKIASCIDDSKRGKRADLGVATKLYRITINNGPCSRQFSRSGRAINEHEFHAAVVSTLAYLVTSASAESDHRRRLLRAALRSTAAIKRALIRFPRL